MAFTFCSTAAFGQSVASTLVDLLFLRQPVVFAFCRTAAFGQPVASAFVALPLLASPARRLFIVGVPTGRYRWQGDWCFDQYAGAGGGHLEIFFFVEEYGVGFYCDPVDLDGFVFDGEFFVYVGDEG